MLRSKRTRPPPIPPISRPLCKRRWRSWPTSKPTTMASGRSWSVGPVPRWSSRACLSSLRHAVSGSASRSYVVSLNSSSRSEARRCSKLVRFIDHALVSAFPMCCSGLVEGLSKGHHEHDLSYLIGDLERAIEPVADAVHPGTGDEVSGGLQSMALHRIRTGEVIPFLVHDQAVSVAKVHGEAGHPPYA